MLALLRHRFTLAPADYRCLPCGYRVTVTGQRAAEDLSWLIARHRQTCPIFPLLTGRYR